VTTLFDPASHEPLTAEPWDEGRAASAIAAIVDDAERAFDAQTLWPIHERDVDGDEGRALSGLYLGAAGVIWALHELGSQRDFAEVADGLDRRFLDEPDFEPEKGEAAPGLWMGRSGILAVAERLSPDPVRRDLLLDVLEQNIGNPTVEVMWGAPGSLLVASEMLDRTGDPRFADLWNRLAEDVWSGFVEDERLGYRIWTQLLYGTVAQYISPAHGFAGNAAALAGRPQLLGPERTAELERETVRTSTATAVIDRDLANWQPLAGVSLDGSPGRVRPIRTQWCHGAPGQVATLAGIAPHDAEYTRLLVAGGGLTWRAGPLRKGPGLCHGTAGNGLAFLALHRRTGDQLWLDRARRFAMHCIEQVEAGRELYGHGWHALWTGDPGAALYLRSCIDPEARIGIDIGCW
jgi:hypothetical protein